MQLGCGNNIQFPSAGREVQDPEQNGATTLLPIIIGLVAGLLLLLALILVVLKRYVTVFKNGTSMHVIYDDFKVHEDTC